MVKPTRRVPDRRLLETSGKRRRQVQVLVEATSHAPLHPPIHQTPSNPDIPPPKRRRTHPHHHHQQEENLILITPTHSVHRVTALQNDVSEKLELANTWNEVAGWKKVAGSCHGLVLLVNKEHDRLLINPTTLRRVKLPDCPQALMRGESLSMSGLGYDSLTDDYKVVALSYYNQDSEYDPDCDHTFVDVYSVKSGVWKRVGNSPYDHAVPEVASGVLVNGALHWLASSREPGHPSVIAAFDLAREAFGEVPAPRGVDEGEFVFNRLVALRGCLCMVVARGINGGGMDVWVMREYGVRDSWEKFSIEGDCDGRDEVKPLCFVGDGEMIVLLREEKRLVVYNFGERSFRELVVDGAPAEFVDGSTYVESLVWPDFGYMRDEGTRVLVENGDDGIV